MVQRKDVHLGLVLLFLFATLVGALGDRERQRKHELQLMELKLKKRVFKIRIPAKPKPRQLGMRDA